MHPDLPITWDDGALLQWSRRQLDTSSELRIDTSRAGSPRRSGHAAPSSASRRGHEAGAQALARVRQLLG